MIERDTVGMKLPRHVAVILDQRRLAREYDADESVRRAAELATWCACAGISILTIYEPTGIIFGNTTSDVRTFKERYQENSTRCAKVCCPIFTKNDSFQS